MKKLILSLSLAITMAGCLIGCGSTAGGASASQNTPSATPNEVAQTDETAETSDSELPVLRIALPTWVGYGPLYVAEEKGFFKECGIDVDLSIVESLNDRKVALASGKLDGLATAADVLVTLSATDVDMGIVWVLDRSNGSDGIVTSPDVETPADLKGKNIATEIGTTEHLFLLRVLEQYGLTADDINLINMTIGDSGTAFIAGKVDAAATYDPYLAEGIASGGKAFTTADYDVDLVDAVGFTREILQNNSDEVMSFVKAMCMADEYIAKNPEECTEIMAKGLSLDTAYVADTLGKLECFDLNGNIEQMGTEEKPGKIYDTCKDESNFYLDQKLIDREADVNALISPEYVRTLAKQ